MMKIFQRVDIRLIFLSRLRRISNSRVMTTLRRKMQKSVEVMDVRTLLINGSSLDQMEKLSSSKQRRFKGKLLKLRYCCTNGFIEQNLINSFLIHSERHYMKKVGT